MNEIWSINDITEVKECVFEEVQPVNYALSLSKSSSCVWTQRLKISSWRTHHVSVHRKTFRRPSILASNIKQGFAAAIQRLSALEIDDPKAVEIFARCLVAMAASGARSDGPGDALYGLGFIRDPVMQVDDKK